MFVPESSKDKVNEFEFMLSKRFQNDLSDFLFSCDEDFVLEQTRLKSRFHLSECKKTLGTFKSLKGFGVLSACVALLLTVGASLLFWDRTEWSERNNVDVNALDLVSSTGDTNVYCLFQTYFNLFSESDFAKNYEGDINEILTNVRNGWTMLDEGSRHVDEQQLDGEFDQTLMSQVSSQNDPRNSEEKENGDVVFSRVERSVILPKCFDVVPICYDSNVEAILQTEPILMSIETIFFHP